nr:ATP-binding protein [Pseudenhygromyxa sp. WMMC2535]
MRLRVLPIFGSGSWTEAEAGERSFGALTFVDVEGDDELGADLFRTLAQNVPGAVYLCRNNESYSMLFLSDGIEAITGYPSDRFIDEELNVTHMRHPDDQRTVRAELDRALAAREPFHLHYRLLHRDGSLRWIEEHGQGIYDDRDELCFLEGAIFDVSERLRAESQRRELQAQLLRAQKLESLGMLAGGIAHDFNNILSAIIGSVELAQMTLPPGQEETMRQVTAYLEEAIEAAGHASELTRQLLAYAGKGQRQRERVSLRSYIESIRELLLATVGEHASLEIQHGPPCELECDAKQLQQIVVNLVRNAAEAIGEREGAVIVRTGQVEIDASAAAAFELPGPISPGRYASLEVEDDGVGMDEDTRTRIFDPFFSTKSAGHGLGTASVLGIVRAHGGGLEVESNLGHGTRFRLLLPAATPKRAPKAFAEVNLLQADDRAALVLVVDDEPRVRRTIVDALKNHGHSVLEAETGTQALALIDQFGSELELAVLDVDMPGIGGVDIFEELRARRPTLPVLFSSGFDQPEHARSHTDHNVDFLPKPYRPQILVERVGRMLGRTRRRT